MGLTDDIVDKAAKNVAHGIAHGVAHKTVHGVNKSAEGFFDAKKEKREEGLYEFLKRSIPSLVYKVKSGQWTAERASNFFNGQLQKLNDKSKANELQNDFNHQLRETDSDAEARVSKKPTVIIDGPSSLRSKQIITLTARTDGLGKPEDYDWQVNGKVNGIDHHISGSSENGRDNKYEIIASGTSEKGTLFITAVGKTSNANAGFVVHALKATQSDESKADDEAEEREAEEAEKDKKRPLYQRAGLWAGKKAANFFASKWIKGLVLGYLEKAGVTAAIGAFIGETWPILLAFLVLIIVSIIAAPMMSHVNAGIYGSTPFQPPADMFSAVSQKVTLDAGGEYTKLTLNRQIFTDLRSELAKFGTSAGISQDVQTQITDTCTKIDQYLSTSNPATQYEKASLDSDLGKEIITSIKSILGKTDQQAPTFTAQTRAPLSNITGYNAWLHNSTPLETETASGMNGHETYIYSHQGKSDAVDLYTSKDSPVYSAFEGKIVNISDDGTGHKKIVVKNGKYEMLYANIDPAKGLSQGTAVTTNTVIGKAATLGDNQTQVHIELTYGGKPVVTTLVDKMSYAGDSNAAPWGEYLWNDMRKILNIK